MQNAAAATPDQVQRLTQIEPLAWVVICPDGFLVLCKERALADGFAMKSHGIVIPLGHYTQRTP